MSRPRLIYVGRVGSAGADPTRRLLAEGVALEPGAEVVLERRRSPWREERGTVRVIVGSQPGRADVHLAGDGVAPEHVRIYQADGRTELRPMQSAPTRVDGRDVSALEWVPLRGGEEIEIGPWKFRFEDAASA
jgi:hypothetical protein